MDSVVFDGKEYVKASVLALKFRYTADYLGQLCRGKKVDARLVGRAWYINLDSLQGHKETRYQPVKKAEVTSREKTNKNYLSRIDVEPVLKNKTVKIFRSKDGGLSELAVKYEADDHSLIPRVNKMAITTHLPVLPAEAERLRVHKGNKDITNFKRVLPDEVFLSGVLKVDGLPEASEAESDMSLEIKPELEKATPPTKVISIRPRSRVASVAGPKDELSVPSKILGTKTQPSLATTKDTVRIAIHRPEKAKITQITPISTVSAHASAKEAEVSSPKTGPVVFKPKAVSRAETLVLPAVKKSSWGLVMAALFLALVTSALTLATNLEVSVERDLYTDKLTLQTANLMKIFGQISR